MANTAELATAYVPIVDRQVTDETHTTPDRARLTYEGIDYTLGVELADQE